MGGLLGGRTLDFAAGRASQSLLPAGFFQFCKKIMVYRVTGVSWQLLLLLGNGANELVQHSIFD